MPPLLSNRRLKRLERMLSALLPIPRRRSAVRQIGQCGVVRFCAQRQSSARPSDVPVLQVLPCPAGRDELVSDDLPIFHWRHYAKSS